MESFYEATWGRVFAAIYDRGLKRTEESGLRDIRRELLSEASGRTIEVGAGTGANLGLYPAAVTELVLAEPDPHMSARLRERASLDGDDAKRPIEIVPARAEELPFPDGSFDTVVFTLVLCTIPDPAAALREAARVLHPGGRVLFCEHVRSDDPGLARWQHRLRGPWSLVAYGCRPDRDTVAEIEASPLRLDRVRLGRMPKAFPFVRPLATGSASRGD